MQGISHLWPLWKSCSIPKGVASHRLRTTVLNKNKYKERFRHLGNWLSSPSKVKAGHGSAHQHFTSTLRGSRQADFHRCQASLVERMSPRPKKATRGDPISKRQKQRRNNSQAVATVWVWNAPHMFIFCVLAPQLVAVLVWRLWRLWKTEIGH